jgi:LAS superfamily LD-carboxypeptidase LdcB
MGRAVDIQTGGGTLPIYFWLQKNAARFGFVRTVPSETWHYHYFPERDQELKR